MNIVEEIRQIFANSMSNSMYFLKKTGTDFPAWAAVFEDNIYAALIPYDGKEIREDFANIKFYTDTYWINKKEQRCLILSSPVESTRNEFAAFCAAFVDPGDDGELRKALLSDPVRWWKDWKELVGNSIVDKKPYAILGELIMYDYLFSKGQNPEWGGPKASSHDLLTDSAEYEVKSTLSRYDKVVHISGQFQLQRTRERLFLYFCRFEQNRNGVSINDYVEKLVDRGVLREELNAKLQKQGYAKGNSAREEKYYVHEILQYEVNENFPRIIPEMMKEECLPTGISHLSYDVDLSVVQGKSVSIE